MSQPLGLCGRPSHSHVWCLKISLVAMQLSPRTKPAHPCRVNVFSNEKPKHLGKNVVFSGTETAHPIQSHRPPY